MTALDPYLIFNGNCAAAMHFYAETFGGTVEALLTYGASPLANQCAADSAERIMMLVDRYGTPWMINGTLAQL